VQGEIAGKYSDIVVVTEEDDRDQDGLEIMKEIAEGAKKAGKVEDKDLFQVHKREEAIAKAFSLAKAGDLVLLLGKGHEDSILGNGPQAAELRHLKQDDSDKRRVISRPYDEVTIAQKVLKSLS
jgi:UDP-N-acetylmuramyl tripeptide synthase